MTTLEPVTKRQMEVLALIVEGHGRGRPYSWREMMARLNINSPNGIKCHVRALVKKGLVAPYDSRAKRCVVPAVRFVPASEL